MKYCRSSLNNSYFGNLWRKFYLTAFDIHGKFYGDRPRGTPPSGGGELKAREVAKYNYFGPIEGYISETVQDRR